MKKLLRYYLFLLFFIGIYSLQSQTLNVISTGQTTSPGTNWSLTGNTLTVTGTANIRASVIVNALANGNLTVVGNTNNFAVTVSEAINSTTAGSGLTIGSMTNTGAITVGADITLAGGIAIMGGDVQLNGNITSTATGDLFFQGLSNAWSIRLATGKTIEKTSGMGLLTLQGNGRINNSTSVGSILASGLARLDVVIINEMDAGSAGLYNVSTGNITTNGGHLWIGAGAKTQKWNGLDVGTTGVPGNTQYNGIDVTGNISTNGGDVFLWAYVGSAARSNGYGDIVALTTNRSISAGSGDITLMTRYNDFVDGSPDISISTTGTLTLAPASGSSFDVGLSYAGTTSSGTFTGSGGMNGLIIQDVSNLSGLVIGSYNGTGVSGDSPYTTTNTANVTLETAISIAGPVSVYGGDITISQNLTSSLADADILLQAIGAINLASSKTIETSGGDVTLRANAGGAANTTTSAITLNSGSSLLSNGGNITLGGNFDGTKGTGLYAASAKVNGAPGVLIIDATLDAAGNAVGGNINIYGRCSTSHDDGIRLEANISTMGAGSIGIYGDAYGGLTDASPDLFYGGITFITNSSTIETENGNINVEGVLTNTQSNGTYALNFYRSVYTSGTNTRNIQIISKTGDIQITGDRGTTSAGGMGSSSWGNIYFGSPLNNSYIASGDIKFSYSSFVGANVKGFKVKTTGAVTYEPSDTSFVNAQTFPYNSYYTVADGASSLTIGKASNIANITMNAATTVAGPITVYGGTITLNANLTTTNYGDISLYTDNALGGLSVARTINASGSFNYIPRSDFFSAPVTYPISNLNLTSSGLLIGKPSNTANITFGSATSIAGPITAYGGTITLNADLTTSNASSISLLAKSGLRFSSSGITLQTSGGDVLLSGDHDANSSGNIIAEGALTITSNGGAISMGGGATGSDFAYGIGTSNTIANDQTAGIWVRGAVNLNSGNGNISIRGYAANASPTLQHVPSWGVGLGLSAVLNTNPASVSINSGTGTILIEGYARNPNGLNTNSYGVVFNNWETTTTEALTITSGNTTANAIRLIGNTENTQQGQRTKNSLRFWSVNNNIRATGIGGGITLSGKTFDGNDHPQICWSGGNILATSGPIVINSENEAVEIGNDLYLGSRSGLTGNTSSSSNIRFSMDDFSVASGVIRVASTGSLTIEPFGSSFTDYTPLTNTIIGFTADTRWSLNENAQTLTGLTIGKTTNTANITMAASTTVAGPITVYGGDIAIDENLNTTAGTTSGNVLIKGSGDLILAANKSITTSGAPVVLWANSDNEATNGSIALRNGSSIVTGSGSVAGGHVWLGGGSDGTTWNGLAVGSGYAVPGTIFTPSNGGGNLQSGIYLERNSISSFGGNIKIAGDGAATTRGIVTYGNTIDIDAGSGKIELEGQVTSTAIGNRGGILFGLHDVSIVSTVNISSSATSGDAITINGVGRGTEDAIGLSGTLNITSSGGGNIVMNGNALGSGRSIVVGNYYHGILNIFANSGNISLNGNTKAVQVAAAFTNGLTSGPSKINIGQGGTITSSSSDVFITSDNIALAAGGIAINASGKVTIEPASNSFASAITFPITNLSIANTITGLTLGKPTNNQNITFGSATSIAGPITAYGGTITLNADLTTTNNGDISLYTDNPLGGLSTPRTLTAAGAFKYIPRGTTFSADVTYPIANLTATSTGLTIGNATNDKNITIDADVTGGAGIELYGNNVNINSNLTTTGTSAIMHLIGNTTIAAGKTITSGGNFTHDGNLTFKSDVNGTAAFGILGGTFTTVSGLATTERYIPSKRGWRLLTAPLKGATNNTIPANWQGVNDEGLLFFSPSTYQSQAMTGYTTGGGMPNIWKYDSVTTQWQSIPNLTTENLFTSTGNNGFLVFATGPSNSTNIASGATETTLRPEGQLITGDVTHSLTADKYHLIGNPYASPLHTEAMVQANANTKVFMVDPTIGTVGGYVTYDGSNWTPTLPSGSEKYIQSGQGFFVRSTSNTTFTITESDKVVGNSNTWFDRASSSANTSSSSSVEADKIRVLLYKQVDSQWQLADGILTVNSATGNNDVDATDTEKMSNFNENIGFRNGTSTLALEYRGLPTIGTIQPMRLTGTTVQPYQLRVKTENYSNSDLQPYVEDTQTGVLTLIPIDGSEVVVNFTGIAATTTAPDSRFRIVYPATLSSDDPTTSLSVGIYPNPVEDKMFTIVLANQDETTQYTLTNLLGQQVQQGKLDTLQNTVSVASLQGGVYVLQVVQSGKTFTTKLIIK